MNPSATNPFERGPGNGEETLRLIAQLPAPQGLEERLMAKIRQAPRTAHVFDWPRNPRWTHSALVRGAAAAAIVCLVLGGGWEIYSRVAPPAASRAVTVPPLAGSKGFSSANAVRTPKTLEGPTLSHPEVAASLVEETGNKKAVRGKKVRHTHRAKAVSN
jgi:hypothetical protein